MLFAVLNSLLKNLSNVLLNFRLIVKLPTSSLLRLRLATVRPKHAQRPDQALV